MTTHPVTIENDAIRCEVWPTIGGKVSSIVGKADKFELLFNYPAELPTEPQYDTPFSNGWVAGWDECFPAVAAGPYIGHPYNAVNIPDHGELWGLPTIAVPTKDGITTVWNGLRFGYRLTRKLALEDASIIARYTLVNVAPFPLRYVWAMHSLMSLQQPVEIQLPQGREMRLSHDAEGQEINASFAWPTAATGEDFSRPAELPARRGWKLFSSDPIASAAIIRYPQRSRAVELNYVADDGHDAYWGIWINTGGWAGHQHFAIEPTSGRFDHLDRAIRDQSAGTIAALGTATWTVTWRLS